MESPLPAVTPGTFARRGFLWLCSVLAASPPARGQARQAAPPPDRSAVRHRPNFVAIQVTPFPWIDEGIDQVLDNLQQKGNVNTVWASTYDYGHPRMTRNGPIPLPDHGKYGSGEEFHGGAFYDYDPKYFRGTALTAFRAPDYGKFNVVAEVAPKAHSRGMHLFAWDYNNAFPAMARNLAGMAQVAEIDVYGARTSRPCFNHPDYRNHLLGKIESYYGGYRTEIDGIAWGCERQGPFLNAIGGRFAGGGIACFCEFCRTRAREREISADRARRGYLEFDRLIRAALRDQRPTDGYFVTFWRLLLEYPEILAWEALWTDSYHEVRSELYGTAKALAPEKPFGFHIQQNMTLSPFYRAGEDYARTREYADFLKLAVYNNAGGPRMAAYVARLCATVFHDARPQDFLPFYYRIMNHDQAPYAGLSTHGLTADYVARETRRAVAGVAGKTRIYPGVDLDVPTEENEKHTAASDVRLALRAAFDAGADGVVLSREYAEMQLANLQMAGDTLREMFRQRP